MGASRSVWNAAEVMRYVSARLSITLHNSKTDWRSQCPIHHGDGPNFSINPSTGQWYCHSQCKRGGGLVALEQELNGGTHEEAGMRVRAIVGGCHNTVNSKHRNGKRKNGARATLVKTYDYVNAQGDLLHQTVRYEPKNFRQRRPDGKGVWIWNLNGIDPVLYNLPAVRDADEVVIVEGEKDADTLIRLGFVATTCAMGSGHWRDRYSSVLLGKKVRIIPDNDEKAGEIHARQVAESLARMGVQDVLVARVPAPHKDSTEWVEAGATR